MEYTVDSDGSLWNLDDPRPQPVRLVGDFYNEPETVHRGCTFLQDAEGSAWEPGPWGCQVKSLGHEDCDEYLLTSPDMTSTDMKALEQLPARFSDSSAASKPPAGSLPSTTLTLETTSAAEVATCTYNFLQQTVVSSIQKVNPQKFTIKALVFRETCGVQSSCLLKVRVWKKDSQRLFVTFHRRQGDSVAFSLVYEEAVAFLLAHFTESKHTGEKARTVHGAPAPPQSALPGQLKAQPLLDLVMDSSHPATQAEAVAALAAVVPSAALGPGGFAEIFDKQVLPGLWAHEQLTVSYPASCLTFALAHHGLAVQLLPAVLRAAVAADTDRLVRLQLAEALRAGACRCAARIDESSGLDPDLRDAILEALRSPACLSEAALVPPFRAALTALEVLV